MTGGWLLAYFRRRSRHAFALRAFSQPFEDWPNGILRKVVEFEYIWMDFLTPNQDLTRGKEALAHCYDAAALDTELARCTFILPNALLPDSTSKSQIRLRDASLRLRTTLTRSDPMDDVVDAPFVPRYATSLVVSRRM